MGAHVHNDADAVRSHIMALTPVAADVASPRHSRGQGGRIVIMRLPFVKMQAAGNDFVVIDGGDFPSDAISRFVRAICDRNRGVGADGLVWLKAIDNGSRFRVRYFNNDGSSAAACLNAFRCIALRVNELTSQKEEITFDTDIGSVMARIIPNGVEVMVPAPSSATVELPAWAPCRTGYSVWTGDPHLVVLLLDSDALGGRFLRDAARLRWWKGVSDHGANVHFVEGKESPWPIRSYERGIEGETLACGSGSLAAASALQDLLGARTSFAFRTYGGSILTVRPNGMCWSVSGPARQVYRGTFLHISKEG
jgi:diaminopimelate epimerase